jgi:hypothetical protein
MRKSGALSLLLPPLPLSPHLREAHGQQDGHAASGAVAAAQDAHKAGLRTRARASERAMSGVTRLSVRCNVVGVAHAHTRSARAWYMPRNSSPRGSVNHSADAAGARAVHKHVSHACSRHKHACTRCVQGARQGAPARTCAPPRARCSCARARGGGGRRRQTHTPRSSERQREARMTARVCARFVDSELAAAQVAQQVGVRKVRRLLLLRARGAGEAAVRAQRERCNHTQNRDDAWRCAQHSTHALPLRARARACDSKAHSCVTRLRQRVELAAQCGQRNRLRVLRFSELRRGCLLQLRPRVQADPVPSAQRRRRRVLLRRLRAASARAKRVSRRPRGRVVSRRGTVRRACSRVRAAPRRARACALTGALSAMAAPQQQRAPGARARRGGGGTL